MASMAAGMGMFGIGERAVEHERSERRARFDDEAVRHLDALYSFALKLARARDDADDLVSDTMLRAFQRWRRNQASIARAKRTLLAIV